MVGAAVAPAGGRSCCDVRVHPLGGRLPTPAVRHLADTAGLGGAGLGRQAIRPQAAVAAQRLSQLPDRVAPIGEPVGLIEVAEVEPEDLGHVLRHHRRMGGAPVPHVGPQVLVDVGPAPEGDRLVADRRLGVRAGYNYSYTFAEQKAEVEKKRRLRIAAETAERVKNFGK